MKDAIEIVVVLDKSGSMGVIQNDTIGTLNTFIDEQKNLPKEAFFSLILFDTGYQMIHESLPIKSVPHLTTDTYTPGRCTALLDAVGRGIDSLGERLRNLKETNRPDKVIFVIITDGEENSSRHYTKDKIKSMIELQQNEYNWQFLFLGANIDAFAGAQNLGIQQRYAANYSHNSRGVRSAGRGMSAAVMDCCTVGRVQESWSRNIVSDDITDDSDSETKDSTNQD